MTILNESSVPAGELKRIVAFLRKRSLAIRKTSICLTSEPDPEAPGACFLTADAFPNGGWARGHHERHHVLVYVPTLARPYPVQQQNPAGNGRCPIVTLQNWQEELVVVLGHELEHIAQYEAALGKPDPMDALVEVVRDTRHRYEVNAEIAAGYMLAEWRAHLDRVAKRQVAA